MPVYSQHVSFSCTYDKTLPVAILSLIPWRETGRQTKDFKIGLSCMCDLTSTIFLSTSTVSMQGNQTLAWGDHKRALLCMKTQHPLYFLCPHARQLCLRKRLSLTAPCQNGTTYNILPLSPAEQPDSSMRRSQTSSPTHENPTSAILLLSTCKATGFGKEVKFNHSRTRMTVQTIYSAGQKSWPVAHKFIENNYKSVLKVYILVYIHRGYKIHRI
jgi:hypothetical protein